MASFTPIYTPTKLTPLPSTPAPSTPNTLAPSSGLGSSAAPKPPPPAASAPTPAPAQAPAPAAPPAGPPTQAQSTGTYVDNLNKATGIATNMIGDTKAATFDDPRSADVNQVLDLMKQRLGGMTQQELQAEQESGLYNIDKQRAQEQEQLASVAGANGISGGAKASLQGQAFREANANQAALQRQLILDNIAQKNQALSTYSGALQNQQGVELGIDQYKAGAHDRDAALKLGLPFQILGGMQGQNATDVSNYFSGKGVDTANNAIAQLAGGASTPAGKSTTNDTHNVMDPSAQYSAAESQKSLDDLANAVKTKMLHSPDGGVPASFSTGLAQQAKKIISEQVEQQYPDEPQSRKDEIIRQKLNDWAAPLGVGKGKLCGPDGVCYVVTAATELGIADISFLRKVTSNCPTRTENIKAYHMWGPKLASLMKTSQVVRRIIGFVLPDTIKVMRGEDASLKGLIGYYLIYMPPTLVCRAWRKLHG